MPFDLLAKPIINPWCTCSARVAVVGSVCLCVCLLSQISPMEHLFVVKTLSHTQWAMKIKKCVGIFLKWLNSNSIKLAVSLTNYPSISAKHMCPVHNKERSGINMSDCY